MTFNSSNYYEKQFPVEIEPEIVSELVTINDVIRYATSYLIENQVYLGHGTDNYWEEAQFLVLCTIGLDPPADDATLNARLTDREKRNIARALTIRVSDRVPAPYIVNRAWFRGIKFYVDERVIIPRSPIAEMIQNNFAPYLDHAPTRILDLCTGSGCIALACANQFRDSVDYIAAVDISEDSLEVTQTNIELYGLEELVEPIASDLFNNLNDEVKYDLIVSNPPYVDQVDLAQMPEEYAKEPELALDGGSDGLDLVKRILADAPRFLKEDGVLVVEVGNSFEALNLQFPDVPFHWVEFKNGGVGVFVLSYQELVDSAKYFEEFRSK